MFVCFGTLPSVESSSSASSLLTLPFGVLWLWMFVLFSIFPGTSGSCQHCWGAGVGCDGSGTACPWVHSIAINSAAITAAVGGAITIAKILPSKLVRLFPRSALEAIASLCTKVRAGGAPFDFTNKTTSEVIAGVKSGSATKAEAIMEFTENIQSATGSTAELTIKKNEAAIKALEHLDVRMMQDTGSTEGALLYVLFKLSSVFCSSVAGATSFDLCGGCDSGSEKMNSRSFSAALSRPKSPIHLYSLLNSFMLCCHAMGLCSFLALGPFLEDIIFEPVRSGAIVWQVAFECLIIYLRLVEANPAEYSVATVLHKAGGIDSIRAQAKAAAILSYPGLSFRADGGIPGNGKNADDKDKSVLFKGTVKGDNKNSKQGCISWNAGRAHFAKNVDASGACKFRHACDQFVSDKGPRGQCLGDHKRADCDYDAAKKVSQPV